MSSDRKLSPFLEVAEETALAASIFIGHGILALLAIFLAWVSHGAIEYFQKTGEKANIFGVTLQYIIESGELIMAMIVISMGIVSGLTVLTVRLFRHLKLPP